MTKSKNDIEEMIDWLRDNHNKSNGELKNVDKIPFIMSYKSYEGNFYESYFNIPLFIDSFPSLDYSASIGSFPVYDLDEGCLSGGYTDPSTSVDFDKLVSFEKFEEILKNYLSTGQLPYSLDEACIEN